MDFSEAIKIIRRKIDWCSTSEYILYVNSGCVCFDRPHYEFSSKVTMAVENLIKELETVLPSNYDARVLRVKLNPYNTFIVFDTRIRKNKTRDDVFRVFMKSKFGMVARVMNENTVVIGL